MGGRAGDDVGRKETRDGRVVTCRERGDGARRKGDERGRGARCVPLSLMVVYDHATVRNQRPEFIL